MTWMVRARSAAEMPVVTPSRASTSAPACSVEAPLSVVGRAGCRVRESLFGYSDGNDSARLARHEIDVVGGDEFGRHHEVAFGGLGLFGHHHDHLAFAQRGENFF